MPTDSPILEARRIARRHPDGASWLLDNIVLALRGGERLAIVGPTGAGKSLLLRAIALLDPLDGGEVFFDGRAVAPRDVPTYRHQVIYLHQRPALVDGDVEDNLRLPCQFASHAGSAFGKERILEMLRPLGRGREFLARPHTALSGGEAQIVALLRAVQLNPRVLLLDEPTASLDEQSTQAVETLISAWFDEHSAERSLIWVSHQEAQARRVADAVLTIEAGRLNQGA